MMEKWGKPRGVVGTLTIDERDGAEGVPAKARFWQVVEQIGERNADKDPDEVLADVTAVVEEVRRERSEREQAAAEGDC